MQVNLPSIRVTQVRARLTTIDSFLTDHFMPFIGQKEASKEVERLYPLDNKEIGSESGGIKLQPCTSVYQFC